MMTGRICLLALQVHLYGIFFRFIFGYSARKVPPGSRPAYWPGFDSR